jgi:tripartite-type tricarboxylate transporter receptor subunit TctC
MRWCGVIGDGLASASAADAGRSKPGANTIVGSEIVAKAAPDGYTFLITTSSTHTNNPDALRQAAVRSGQDLIPVSLVSLGTILIAVKADAPFSDLRGMAAWVKGLGRPATYGSWGIGSSGHLYGLMLERALGGLYTHVPYRGDVPALQDVANGTLDLTWASPVSAKPQIAAGKVKAIAAAGSKRSAAMPELTTFAEQLIAGFDLSLFVAAYAPAGTPAAIVNRLQSEIKAVISDPPGRREDDRAGPDAGRFDAGRACRRAGARDADLGRPDPPVRRQGRVALRVGADRIVHRRKAVAGEQGRQFVLDAPHQRRPLIDHCRIELHQRGAGADLGIGVGARADAAAADERELASTRLGRAAYDLGCERREACAGKTAGLVARVERSDGGRDRVCCR